MNACYAKPKDYCADDETARIDVHVVAYHFEVSSATCTSVTRSSRAMIFAWVLARSFSSGSSAPALVAASA
eukprot:6288077-Pyramimonas_sp.AAC.1